MTKKRIFSEEHKRKLSEAAKRRGPKFGEENNRWAGDNVGYSGIHTWMRNTFGHANACEVCKTTTASIFDWANLSGTYKRDRSDWKMMCRSCHVAFDHKARMRTGVMIEFNGQTKNIKEWAAHFGMKYTTLYARLKIYKMPPEEAFLKFVSCDQALRKVCNVRPQ